MGDSRLQVEDNGRFLGGEWLTISDSILQIDDNKRFLSEGWMSMGDLRRPVSNNLRVKSVGENGQFQEAGGWEWAIPGCKWERMGDFR